MISEHRILKEIIHKKKENKIKKRRDLLYSGTAEWMEKNENGKVAGR